MNKHSLTQSKIVEDEILKCIAEGMIKKSTIITAVSSRLDVPRSTVRRVKFNLIEKLHSHIEILEGK